MTYLPAGCASPDDAEISQFWNRVDASVDLTTKAYSVRWIGLDHESTEDVIELILNGDKTGTYTLPWIIEQTDHPQPHPDEYIVLIDYSGHPRLVFSLEHIEEVQFGNITSEHTSIDGTPVRDLSVWKPLHTLYWSAMLAPFGLEVADHMPVLVEKFRLIYPIQ